MNQIEVAYVLLRFPYLTETFVAEEIKKVQSIGIKVHLFSLLPQRDELVHPVSAELACQTMYVPNLLSPSLIWSQLFFLRKVPGLYIKLLWILLKQPTPDYTFLMKRLVIFLKAIWISKRLINSPVQLIHTHFAWLSAAASMVVSQLLDLPFTTTTHAYDIYSHKNDLLALTTRMADRVVTISEFNKQTMHEMNSSLNGQQIEVIHCGIDLDNFKVADRQTTNQVFQITSIGTLIEKKGHEYLILACKLLEARGIDFRCVIVGEGKLRKTLQALIQDLNLEKKVSLVGTQTQTWVRGRLRNSDLFALACVVTDDGQRDGIPVAIMEALALERPVISTPVSGIPELIQHGETGLLVPERDANALATAIARMAQDSSLSQKLACKGRTLVEREFDISKNSVQLSDLFRQVIEERRN